MTLQDLKIYVLEQGKKYPSLRDEIISFWTLCNDEIENGESEDNEIYLCQESIEELINEQ